MQSTKFVLLINRRRSSSLLVHATCPGTSFSAVRPFSIDAPPPIEEEIPQDTRKKKTYDFHQNYRPHRVIFGCGLTRTGSLAIDKYIKHSFLPEVIYAPKVVTKMKGKEIKMVSAGCGFSLFASNSKLYGSGLNNFYQIGGPLRGKGFEGAHDWYYQGRFIPLPEDAGKIISIAAGRLHSVIATENGIFCLGSNSHGQCGVNPEEAPVVAHNRSNKLRRLKISDDSPIKQVHCCLDTSFVLLENGKVYAWGLGTDGQLGNGEKEFQWSPKLVGGDLLGVRVAQIDGNTDTIIAISDDGDLFLWGQNEYGQMKVLTDEPQIFSPRHIPFKLGKVVSAAATGSSCIVCNSQGHVFTWGSEVLGFGPKIQYLDRPMQLDAPLFQATASDGGFVQKVFAGGCLMGAVTEAGQLFTWGANRNGCLGLGHHNHQYFPFQVHLQYPIRTLSMGPDHTLFATR